MQVIQWDKDQAKKITRSIETVLKPELRAKVGRILREVQLKGDLAVHKLTREFDGVDISQKRLAVTEGDINRAFEQVSIDFVPILKQIQQNAIPYYEKDMAASYRVGGRDKVVLEKLVRPLERVGVYIPGGQAPLVSTVYMTVIPAKVAGVKEIVIATPPNRETGDVNPHLLVVASLLGVKEIYRVGGAQAIAAMAYGTKTIRKVDKIVGPGNPYVTEAKRQVYGFVDIDMVAGPSEVLILADEHADPDFITCDLLAQTEHFGGTGILITPSTRIVDLLRKRVEEGFIVHVKSLEEGCEVVNDIAPEHLEILTATPRKWLAHIRHAGAVFLGPNSPAVIGDYIAGPSHVLPTAGTARFFSPLSTRTFQKSIQVISYTKEALARVRKSVERLTEIEGLVLHRISLEARFADGRDKKGPTPS